jgi:thiol-disulfide isomerase/thioredoxin
MKQILALLCLFSLFSCHNRKDAAASISTLPAFGMLLMDSTTILVTQEVPSGRPFLVMYFSPDCPYCQKETKMLISNIDTLKTVRIYLLSNAPFNEIKNFYSYYHLRQFQNITIGQDYNHSFVLAFRPTSIPYMAIYNSNKKLVRVVKGESEITTIIRFVNS